jgi:hypothetical protein
VAYLTNLPNDDIVDIDYQATTYGVQTTCKPVSQDCNLRSPDNANIPYSCPNYAGDEGNFQGDLVANDATGWNLTIYTDANGQHVDAANGVDNPFSLIVAAAVDQTRGGTLDPETDPKIIQIGHGGFAFILFCQISVYDATYSFVNGQVSKMTLTISNSSVVNAVESVYDFGTIPTTYLQNAATLSSYAIGSQDLANRFAVYVSRLGLSLFSGGLQTTPAELTQLRSQILVTKVQPAPFWFLVVSLLLFALTGTIMAAVAFITGKGDVREYQGRLTITGLIAYMFEGERAQYPVKELEDIFGERGGGADTRVTLAKSSVFGGYEYGTSST